MTIKINGVATDPFCTGVIDHLGHVIKLGTEIPNSKKKDCLVRNTDLEILSPKVQLRVRKD